jgi:uncharacterized membrane protein YozB (DUF420 family)
VLRDSYRGWRMRQSPIPPHLIKTSCILATTSLSLLFQIIYLLYTTFATQPSIGFSVSVYFLIEIIPSILLFILFFPLSTNRVEKTSNSPSKTSNSQISFDKFSIQN